MYVARIWHADTDIHTNMNRTNFSLLLCTHVETEEAKYKRNGNNVPITTVTPQRVMLSCRWVRLTSS